MVVVLIIAILMAIAVPSYLNAQSKAKDRAAQSDLRNGLTAAKTQSADYTGKFFKAAATITDATSLNGVEPSLTFAATPSTTAIGVNVEPTTGSAIVLTRTSASGTVYGIKALSTGQITYCSGASATTASTAASAAAATCTNGW